MKSEIIDNQLHVEGLKDPLIRLEHRTLWLTVDSIVFTSGYDRYEPDEPVRQSLRVRGRARMDPNGHKFRIAGTQTWADVAVFNLRSLDETVDTQKYMWTALVSYMKADDEFDTGNYFYVEAYVPRDVLDDMRDAAVNGSLLQLKVGLDAVGLWVESFARYAPFDCGFDWMLRPSEDGLDVQGRHDVRIKDLFIDIGAASALKVTEKMSSSSDPDDDGSPARGDGGGAGNEAADADGGVAATAKRRGWFS